MRKLEVIESEISEIEEQLNMLDNLKGINRNKLNQLMKERHEVLYKKGNEFEAIIKKASDNLHTKWHKTGGYDEIRLLEVIQTGIMLIAERHYDQQEYIVIADFEGKIKRLFKEEN